MLKVLFLSPVSYFKGGAETCLFDMMSNPEIQPILVVPKLGELSNEAAIRGIPCFSISFDAIENIKRPFSFMKGLLVLKSLFNASQELKKICASENVKIIHSNGLKAHAINCIVSMTSKNLSIVHIHDIPLTKSEKFFWRLMQLSCNTIIIVSRPCWPNFKIPKNAKIVHNGIALNKENQTHKKDFFNRTINIGFCGRIHPAKGLHILLDWLEAGRDNGLKLNLIVRGSFSNDAPNYEETIRKKIIDKNMHNFVSFEGHIKDQDALYNNLDIVCVPSIVPDPLPRSVMEAMARGLIVFGYPAGGIPEMINHEKNGFLISNSKEFINYIMKINDNPLYHHDIIENSILTISENFSLESLFLELNNIYSVYKNKT